MAVQLLHGAIGAPSDWAELLPRLGSMPAHALDLYGRGVRQFDQFAAGLCEDANAGDCLAGYSMGGRLAMHALVRPGAPWSKAVIISADPGHGHDPDRAKGDASWANLARSDWPEFCDQWSAEALFAEDDVDWDRSEYSAERQEAVAKGFEVWSVGKQRDLRSELKDVEIPILWIVGARDAKFVGLAESIVPILRDAQLLVVADAGHRVPWEQPEVVAEAIRSFLS